MFPNVPNNRPPSDGELAALCLGGDLDAGIALCDRLWKRGGDVTVERLLTIACPNCSVTVFAFDVLADALHEARLRRYLKEFDG